MPVILVVDDSKIDRVLITDLLKREPMDWIVEVAESAEQALLCLNDMPIDCVITDLIMPGTSGLGLLEYVQKQVRKIPVVVISGNEDAATAIEAIRKGAASYVPKTELASRLNATVKQVLTAYQSEKSYHQLIRCVDDIAIRLRLPNDPTLIPALVNVLQQLAVGAGLCGEEGSARLGIAIEEAAINALYHGNLALPATHVVAVRGLLRDGERVPVIEDRRKEDGYKDRWIHVHAQLTRDSVELTIRDEGEGFSADAIERDTSQHRGLTLIRNLVDEVRFNEKGNEITLVKNSEVVAIEPGLPLEE